LWKISYAEVAESCGVKFEFPNGATPLDPDEAEGLLPEHIETKSELNEWEQQNILEGERWAFEQKRGELLTVDFMFQLHKALFGNTWRWAGKIRRTEKNIGIDPAGIESELNTLCKNVAAQLEHKSYSLDEIAARFHHRLVAIHPFSNGNGRFSRTMADLLLVQYGGERFTWGKG
jgi:Fic-DOC domain mobile mystery protein B